jgi:hypothetical protein
MAEEKKGYTFLSTLLVIEFELLPGDDWIAVPSRDGWLIPEEEYLRLVGRPN